MSDTPLRIAVFASGSGSNLEAILQAIEDGSLINASVVAVISNKSQARALQRARDRDIKAAHLSPNNFGDEEAYLKALQEVLRPERVNFIALAGYLKKIPIALVREYKGRMLNIHPSLLPAFGGAGMYGIKIHKAVLERGVRWTGVTIHFVDEDYDTGPILLQKPVPVHLNDTAESVASRVLDVEHRIYPEALRLCAEGRVTVQDRKVTIDPTVPRPSQ